MSDQKNLIVGAGWLMVTVAGRTYIGPREEAPDAEEPALPPEGESAEPDDEDEPEPESGLIVLSPCYELREARVQVRNPAGQVQDALVLQAVPYGLFGHAVRVTLVPDSIVEVGELAPPDRAMVVEWVKQAEKTKTEVRAQRAGLSLVKP